jgi:DNA-directed RNA polymerase subunit RPC12/RpoP
MKIKIFVEGIEVNEFPKYLCEDCGKVFDSPGRRYSPGGDTDMECPFCESWNFYRSHNGKRLVEFGFVNSRSEFAADNHIKEDGFHFRYWNV